MSCQTGLRACGRVVWALGLLGCRFNGLTGCCLADGSSAWSARLPDWRAVSASGPCLVKCLGKDLPHEVGGVRRLEGCAGLRVKVIYTLDCQSASWSIGSFAFVSNRTCFNRSTLQGVYMCVRVCGQRGLGHPPGKFGFVVSLLLLLSQIMPYKLLTILSHLKRSFLGQKKQQQSSTKAGSALKS